VITLEISRGLGNAEADWTRYVEAWEYDFELYPAKKPIVKPVQRGSIFEVEYTDGRGRWSSRHKIRAFHRSRVDENDQLNQYNVTMTAVPAAAWRSPQGRKLLQAFNSMRVSQ